uniref:uncharacterized protein LOC131106081 n=1 Tax=Doryrhamphus excisus TaxID=161450 RepID=UPI0025ADF89A|nr:uncharacterized protein LOC131106081 [Doryrhamphus excisus]
MSVMRNELVWSIKKNLFRLSSADLYQVARRIAADGQDTVTLSESDDENSMNYITTHLQSHTLLELEDEGMGQLLTLNDIVCKMVSGAAIGLPANVDVDITHALSRSTLSTVTAEHTPPPSHPHSQHTTTQLDNLSNTTNITQHETTAQSVGELRRVYDELGESIRRYEAEGSRQATTLSMSRPPPFTEGMVSLKDLPYIQCREFKVHGGQIADNTSDITYNNISKQIDEGVREGFTGTEVVRGLLKIVKPSTFRDMLANKDEISVLELKGFLRSHLGEKATTEMLQELMCSRQAEQESPQQFLYRIIRLKQKLLFQCQSRDRGPTDV